MKRVRTFAFALCAVCALAAQAVAQESGSKANAEASKAKSCCKKGDAKGCCKKGNCAKKAEGCCAKAAATSSRYQLLLGPNPFMRERHVLSVAVPQDFYLRNAGNGAMFTTLDGDKQLMVTYMPQGHGQRITTADQWADLVLKRAKAPQLDTQYRGTISDVAKGPSYTLANGLKAATVRYRVTIETDKGKLEIRNWALGVVTADGKLFNAIAEVRRDGSRPENTLETWQGRMEREFGAVFKSLTVKNLDAQQAKDTPKTVEAK